MIYLLLKSKNCNFRSEFLLFKKNFYCIYCKMYSEHKDLQTLSFNAYSEFTSVRKAWQKKIEFLIFLILFFFKFHDSAPPNRTSCLPNRLLESIDFNPKEALKFSSVRPNRIESWNFENENYRFILIRIQFEGFCVLIKE